VDKNENEEEDVIAEDMKTDFISAPSAYCSLHKTDCDLGLKRVQCLRKQLENRPGDLKLVIA
jgi:hypothetical protein